MLPPQISDPNKATAQVASPSGLFEYRGAILSPKDNRGRAGGYSLRSLGTNLRRSERENGEVHDEARGSLPAGPHGFENDLAEMPQADFWCRHPELVRLILWLR